MKKIIAVLLAAVMTLAFLPVVAEEAAAAAAEAPAAAASTVNVQIAVDKETAQKAAAAFGMPEEQAATIDPVLEFLNALNIRVTSAEGCVQVDLGLNGTDALSLAGTSTEEGLKIASSLFPNYILTLSTESLQGMMQQYMTMMGGAGEGEAGGADMTALAAAVSGYFTEFSAVFEMAVKPGEAEQGTFEFEGAAFDTRTPVDVDEAALTEATRKLMSDLLNDEAVRGMLASVPDFNAEEALKAIDEALTEEHIPEVEAAVYSSSGNPMVTYTRSEATYKGAEAPAYVFTMLSNGAEGMKMKLQAAETGMEIEMAVSYSAGGLFISYTQGGMYWAFAFSAGENGAMIFDVYAVEKEKPLLTLTVTAAQGGERTLSLDPEGKTVLAIEDLQGENAAEALTGLQQDMMANLGQLMAMPEVTGLISAFTPRQVTEEPQATVEADPSAWKTLGDILALNPGESQSSWGDGQFAMAFEYGGKYWLVKASAPEEVLKAYESVDFFDEERDAKQAAVIGECAIESVTDLETLALSREELDQWTGKSGQDMLDAGWELNGWHSEGKGLLVIMVNGSFQYNVSFGDTVETPEWGGELKMEEGVVDSITFAGPSYNFSVE